MAFRASRRLFVSNLPWTVGTREFFEYFSQFGPIVNHTVVFDRQTGLSKKYGFVQFGNEDVVKDLFKQKTHYLEGNILKISEQIEKPDFKRRN